RLEVVVQPEPDGVGGRLRLEHLERGASRGDRRLLRLAEAIGVVVRLSRPAAAEAVAELGVAAHRATGMQVGVLVEADGIKVRVLGGIDRELEATAREPAMRG